MSLAASLAGFCARQLLSKGWDYLKDRFTDHSDALPKALKNANDRTWNAFRNVLSDGYLDAVAGWFAASDDKGMRDQMKQFIAGALKDQPADFRQQCLDELESADAARMLLAPSLAEVTDETPRFEKYSPDRMCEGANQFVGQLAGTLRAEGYKALATLICLRPEGTELPLVVLSFTFFFRCELRGNPQLLGELQFDMIENVTATLRTMLQALYDNSEQLNRIEEELRKQGEEARAAKDEILAAINAQKSSKSDQQRLFDELCRKYPHLATPEAWEMLAKMFDQAGQPGLAQQSRQRGAKLAPPQRPRFKPGDLVPGRSDWVLERHLGGGGFGEVWLARHPRLRERAVKFFRPLFREDSDMLHESNVIARIMRETGRGFLRDSIVELLDEHLEGLTPWLMYEYVEGVTLAQGILHWAKLPAHKRFQEVTVALRMIASAVGHFHRLDPPIVHRDLKPANILHDKHAKRLRITDFGIGGIAARDLIEAEKHGTLTRGAMLQASLYGSYTPIYASPEQKRGDLPHPKDDVHALGVIAYQMLTGRLDRAPGPHFARELHKLGVEKTLIDLIGACVDDAELRPKDASEIAQALAAPKPTAPKPAAEPREPEGTPPPRSVPADSYADIREDEDAYLAALKVGKHKNFFAGRAPTRIAPWKDAAESGFAPAQNLYGECLAHGIAAAQDVFQAVAWYRKAAEQGHAAAQNNLGWMYQERRADYVQAVAWYRKAAEQGNAMAQYNLGRMYEEGHGVAKDDNQAVAWYRKAAEQGNVYAQTELGRMYEKGRGVAQNDFKAVAWYRKAAEQGSDGAQRALRRLGSTAKPA